MILGRESIFYIKYNGTFVPISCETSNSLEESAEMLGTTTRDNAGWETAIPTMQSYSFNINGQSLFENSGNMLSYFRLAQMKRDRVLFEWERRTLDNIYKDSGKGHIINISDANEADGYATFSMTIQGYGKPIMTKLVAGNYVPLLSQEDNSLIYNEDNNAITTE